MPFFVLSFLFQICYHLFLFQLILIFLHCFTALILSFMRLQIHEPKKSYGKITSEKNGVKDFFK
ncbi:hypothetical protein HCCG_00030 [Helicobacter cinaedi CCUG 18818 = ATCC BAA-847]|uniref:Uncharacterized protein n=1 Tax=Helicobacter cinaedi CCUG 18818 = ATCC BAA-847 TaxID=537971 RepID=A0ABN0B9U8_9HELI|nr:hypothetical protein HCCG_00030 [Helicobacter cinaedi CCUG 18818 = ATCC BAA-847]